MAKSRNQLGKSNLGRDVNRLVVAINHAPTLVTGSDHGTLSGLDGDDHPQYFNLNQDETVLGQPTLNPGSARPPLVLHANGQDQTVVGLRADSLNKSVLAGAGLDTGGILTADVTLNVGAGDGINVLTDTIEVDLGTGLEIDAGQIIHSTGDLGDLHTNYPEIDQVETITGAWKWSIDLIPNLTDTYDIGSSTKLWKTGWLSELEAILFVTNAVRVEAGWLIVAHDGGTLAEDIDATQATIDFGKAMTNGDFVVLRGNLKVEYLSITSLSSGTIYNVSRGLDSGGTGDIWPSGQVFLVLGQTGDGRIELTADNTDSPKISFMSQGATYNAQTEYARIGNLRSSYGIGAADTFGVGIGRDETGYNYLSITAAGGLEFYDTADTVVGQLTGTAWTLGNATIDHVLIQSTGIQFQDGSTVKMKLQTDGDFFIGSDLSAAATTYFSIFATAQTYNTESMAAGDMLIGDNSASKANILWDKSAGILYFRGGTTNQTYVDTTGAFAAGGGSVQLDADGVWIEAYTSAPYSTTHAIDMGPSGDRDAGYMQGSSFGGVQYITIMAQDATTDSSITLLSSGFLRLFADDTVEVYSEFLVKAGNNAYFNEGIYVGSNSGTTERGRVVTTTGATGNSGLFVNEIANANQKIGITVRNKAGASFEDDEMFSLKNLGVAHAMTTISETDTLGFSRGWSEYGGLYIGGLSEGAQVRGLSLHGYTVAQSITHTSAGVGVVNIEAHDANGTGTQALGTNGIVLSIRNNGTTGAIFTGDGRLFLDSTSTINKWDDFDDMALLEGFRGLTTKQILSERTAEWMDQARPILEETGIMTFGKDGKNFVNILGLQTLTIDAIRQLYAKMERYETALLGLGIEPKMLTG